MLVSVSLSVCFFVLLRCCGSVFDVAAAVQFLILLLLLLLLVWQVTLPDDVMMEEDTTLATLAPIIKSGGAVPPRCGIYSGATILRKTLIHDYS